MLFCSYSALPNSIFQDFFAGNDEKGPDYSLYLL